MLRKNMKLALVVMMLSTVAAKVASPEADTSDLADYQPVGQLTWPSSTAKPRRERREAADEGLKGPGARQARASSVESWSRQQLPARAQLEEDLPPPIRAHYAPKADFVTSGSGRPYRPSQPAEGRDSRELPLTRAIDDYDVPVFRNVVREHDFDVHIPSRDYYYPDRYRSQRDYYYRGPPSPYVYDRYRDDDEAYESYGRYRPPPPPPPPPPPKPKRIVYYATLPEIVRKPPPTPQDLRSQYQRPYDPPLRGPETHLDPADRNRLPGPESSRRPLRYPYDPSYDNYVKRSSFYDRRRPIYASGEDERSRDYERNRPSFKEKMRSEDLKLENQISRVGDDRRIPWPVQIGTEVNVKDKERIPGRKIFGQLEGYERYEGTRTKKILGNAERKEDTSEEDNNKNSNNETNNNNNNNNN